MTITVHHKNRKWEWDKNRSYSGYPEWKSDKGNFVFSKRLITQLERKASIQFGQLKTKTNKN